MVTPDSMHGSSRIEVPREGTGREGAERRSGINSLASIVSGGVVPMLLFSRRSTGNMANRERPRWVSRRRQEGEYQIRTTCVRIPLFSRLQIFAPLPYDDGRYTPRKYCDYNRDALNKQLKLRIAHKARVAPSRIVVLTIEDVGYGINNKHGEGRGVGGDDGRDNDVTKHDASGEHNERND